MSPAESLARLRLARTEGVGPQTFRRLLAQHGSAEAALAALPRQAARRGAAFALAPEDAVRRRGGRPGPHGRHLAAHRHPRLPAAARPGGGRAARARRARRPRRAAPAAGGAGGRPLGLGRRAAHGGGAGRGAGPRRPRRHLRPRPRGGRGRPSRRAARGAGPPSRPSRAASTSPTRPRTRRSRPASRPKGARWWPKPRSAPRRWRGTSPAETGSWRASSSASWWWRRRSAPGRSSRPGRRWRRGELFAVPGSPLRPAREGLQRLIRQGAHLTEGAETCWRNCPRRPARLPPPAQRPRPERCSTRCRSRLQPGATPPKFLNSLGGAPRRG
jgi:DNA processing protein